MLRDVFYYGKKPNAHPRERYAENLQDARQQCSTEHFWVINEFSDYRNFDWDFDFEFLPDEDVWAIDHNNVWPSQHQKDSGTWLCPKEHSDIIIYRCDVDPVIRKNEKQSENWVELDLIDHTKFDFSWHPDPSDPPFIYKWGCKFYPAEIKHVLEYVVPGATQTKYMNRIVELLPQTDLWVEHQEIDKHKFDMSWRPDPLDNSYIYIWGNKYIDGKLKPTLEYRTPGATDVKYMPELLEVLPEWDRWEIHHPVVKSSFDFSWRPDPREPDYNYVFGNNQYSAELMPTIIYKMPYATQDKYVPDVVAKLDTNMTNWVIPDNLDVSEFDFSWVPNPHDPPYIYEFGTQWQDNGGPQYVTEGATEKTYVSVQKAKRLATIEGWEVFGNYHISGFDFSWHPDINSPPYVYIFGNQWYDAEIMPTLKYAVEGATEIKYINDIKAILGDDRVNWIIPDNIDQSSFDFSWKPNPNDPPYIYEFATQWQKTGGPRYIVDNATETKYVDFQKAKILPTSDNWEIPDYIDVSDFDFSWHPDATDPAYIYQFGTQWALTGGPRYVVEGATEVKYVEGLIARAGPNMTNWEVPENIDAKSFDFSWHPYAEDDPFIYQFGTQHQKTGGPRYIVDNATETKYVDLQKAKILPTTDNWEIPDYIDVSDFDFSWHPDDTEEPYIYVFGTQWAISGGPRYVIDNATETKYVDTLKAKALPNYSNWVYDENTIDIDNFDFSWHPSIEDSPYIYQFGTQWQKTGGPRYTVVGATEIKYSDVQKAIAKPNINNFEIIDNVVIDSFDFSWHPDDTEEPYIYVFGNNQYPAEVMPTIKYVVQGATQTKYVTDIKATLGQDRTNWEIKVSIDEDNFDFSWKPNPNDPPYTYVWGNKYIPGIYEPTLVYNTPGATEVKYMTDDAPVSPQWDRWQIPDDIEESSFDYSWRPDPREPDLIYQFGTQWQKTGGPRYIVPGASEIKYIDNPTAIRKAVQSSLWKIKIPIKSFDFSWHPDDTEQPYIYVFGNSQYSAEEMPTIEYHVKGATETKYINDTVAYLAPNMNNWDVPKNIDAASFDFSWVPHPKSPPYIYEFATVWNDRGGPKYKVPGATEYFYIEDIKAKTLPSRLNWEIPKGINVRTFDFSWVPHPMAPPYIYQFGTKLDNNDGPRYVTPNNNGEVVYLERVELSSTSDINVGQYYIDTTLEDLINNHPNEIFWALRKNIDYTEFDFTWRPTTVEIAYELDYVHVFGSPESELTQTYFVSAEHYLRGKTEFKFIEDLELNEDTLAKLFKKPDMFFIDKSNSESQERFLKLQERFPNIQKTRYLNTWVDTINRCAKKATTELIWILNSELDYSEFEFNYYPNPWQMKMVHVFGTQWSHWGTTFLINTETFAEDTKYIKIIEHLSNLNFVKSLRAKAVDCVYDVVMINHGNKETTDICNQIDNKIGDNDIIVVDYNYSYLNTLKNVISTLPVKKEHYVWVCSSVCDYSNFDFTYICDPFTRDNLHVFPSGKQKFGDTFLMNVNRTRELIDNITELGEYDQVNYNQTMRVNRLEAPTLVTSHDTLVDAIKDSILDIDFPYATLVTTDNTDLELADIEPLNLWSRDTKNIIITSSGATRIVIPREAKDYISHELYDYPYIKRAPKLVKSNPLDIVYLSNGETGAEENYQHLLKIAENLPNRVVRVDGVNGRAKAYHTAAEASNTPWFFTVFAKLEVNSKFDWSWQPDRMQVAKHYIFHAKNPVNGLIYGHQAMIAYNKKLTLANEGRGLDFTLDDEHEVVPLVSGTARYNTDNFSTWRTAFRETIKLRQSNDDDSRERLEAWLNKAEGDFAEYSIKGAQDAVNYHDEVNGDFDKLKLSYEWAWLENYFNKL